MWMISFIEKLAFIFLVSHDIEILIGEREIPGVTPLSRLAIEGGNPDTSAGRCSPTLRRAPEFVSAGEDVLHAGPPHPLFLHHPFTHNLIYSRLDETGCDLFPV